jgi:Domain of Unknown Function (DUF1080)
MSLMYPPGGGQTIQSCMRCGLPLLPDVPVCRNCGWYNALPPQQFAASVPGPSAQYQRSNYNGYAGPIGAQSGIYFAPPVPPAPSTGTFQPPMPGFAPGSYYRQPQPPEPEPKQGPNVVAILLLIVAILLLIGSGCIAGYFFLFKNQTGPTAVVTPTVAIVTPSVKPLFGDNFQNNTNKWILASVSGQYAVSISGGQMVLEDDHNQIFWEVVPGQTFSDFRLDVDAKLTKGDKTNGYGVYIRGIATQTSDIGLFYRFELYGDGTFGLFKGILDTNGNPTNTSLTGKDLISNSAIQTEGTSNHITIIARGSNMQFMVNGVSVYSLTDSSYKGGQVALFVSNVSTAPPIAQAMFAHLAIFPVS